MYFKVIKSGTNLYWCHCPGPSLGSALETAGGFYPHTFCAHPTSKPWLHYCSSTTKLEGSLQSLECSPLV